MTTEFYNEQPLISFIIVCVDHNTDMLRNCIGSIVNLSLRASEREIIVVDDGSERFSPESLGTYRDDVLYIRQKKQGLNNARNIGLRIATGGYVQFVSGEDWLIRGGYEHCIDIIRYNHPDIVLFDSTRKEKENEVYYIPEPVDGAQYMRHNDLNVGVCGYAFKRQILQNLRFTPNISCEDEGFTPQLFLRAEAVYSTNIAAYYCNKCHVFNKRSKSKRMLVKQLNDMEHIIFHLNELLGTLPVIERQAMERRVAQLTLEYILSIIRQTHSSGQLNERLKRLETKGLFPLPERKYNTSYSILRRGVNNKYTRKLMKLMLR